MGKVMWSALISWKQAKALGSAVFWFVVGAFFIVLFSLGAEANKKERTEFRSSKRDGLVEGITTHHATEINGHTLTCVKKRSTINSSCEVWMIEYPDNSVVFVK